MCIAGALVMTAVIGGTLAGMNKETDEESVAEITVNSFGIGVTGTGIGENGEESKVISLDAAAAPGGTVTIERSIENNGSYDLYARIVINKKWEVDKSAETIQLVFDPELVKNWINPYEATMSKDDEQIILYYTLPITKDAEVKLPLTGIQFDSSLNNDYAGKSVSIDISVDAVQAAVVKDSMLSEWGVFPTIDENGVITAITE